MGTSRVWGDALEEGDDAGQHQVLVGVPGLPSFQDGRSSCWSPGLVQKRD